MEIVADPAFADEGKANMDRVVDHPFTCKAHPESLGREWEE